MKRGVSPIMAEIMMIALAFMIGVAVFSWFGGLSRGSLSKGKERYDVVVDCSMVNGELVSFFLYPQEGKVKVLVSSLTKEIYPVRKIEVVNKKGEKCKIEVYENAEPGKISTIEGNCSVISSCDDFRSLYVGSYCINKGLYYDGALDSLKDGTVCKKPDNRLFK